MTAVIINGYKLEGKKKTRFIFRCDNRLLPKLETEIQAVLYFTLSNLNIKNVIAK